MDAPTRGFETGWFGNNHGADPGPGRAVQDSPTATRNAHMSSGTARPVVVDDVDDDRIEAEFDRFRRTRDPVTRNRLVEVHLPLADRCARRYLHRGEPLADLMQVARMALVGAVERFDPDRGGRFESFAVPTILGELRHHFRDNCWFVSVPRPVKDLRTRVFRASEQIGQQLGRQPTTTEIAEAIGVPEERVAMTLDSNRHYRPASWESIIEQRGQSAPSVGSGSGDDVDDTSTDRVEVARTVANLDERLQQIVVWRFYEECTQREIGRRLGVGQVQVSRLLARALNELRREVGHLDLNASAS